MLKALDVIWIFDETIEPPGPKMVVCVEPHMGLFFRINSKPDWQSPIKLEKSSHDFLDHDSYLECGLPLEMDDYIIEESLRRKGVIGRILPTLASRIYEVVSNEPTLPETDKEAIRKALNIVTR